MKNILFILCFATCTVGFGQTKEETINWLNEKFEKYLIYYMPTNKNFSFAINECNIVITAEEKCRNMNVDIHYTIKRTLPVSGVKIDGLGRFIYTTKAIEDEVNDLINHTTEKYYSNSSSNFEYPCALWVKIDEREENIFSRIEKALNHLATFCLQKKETF